AARYQNRTNEDHSHFQEVILPQMEALKDIIPALGVRQLSVDDVEGDDLIGIAADKLSNEDARIIIVSSDQDLYQLIAENVELFEPIKKKHFTFNDFVATYNMAPIQWVEVKALMGDEGDDIPGVPGIGEKIAVKLCNQFGDGQAVIEEAKNSPKSAVMKRIPEYEDKRK